jgi:hypothetical protein
LHIVKRNTMDLEETIDAVLHMMCERLKAGTNPVECVVDDAKRRLMLVCLTGMSIENDHLLNHLPPVELLLDSSHE